jgi:Relaxase/Mobilisation nuclease domain
MANERLFDLVSYARRGPGRRDRLSPGAIAQVARTVRRTPEVMVKVLSRGGRDLKAVGRHLDYLRLRDEGELGLETDDGQRLTGDTVTQDLLESWDLDLEEQRRCSDLDARGGGSTKLVHKLLFSMPAGTPPDKVLAAVKNFAREEFGLKHRYAMVLHTDEPHPHVHMLLKAVSERGERLHIRKATLRAWRREFARHLRELGVPANATERAVRGATRIDKKDGVYRAGLRGDSKHIRTRTEAVARELSAGTLRVEPGAAQLATTRRAVQFTWHKVSDALAHDGQRALASEVRRFVKQMPAPLTEKQQLAADLLARSERPALVRGRAS